jgi:hypothetical protein
MKSLTLTQTNESIVEDLFENSAGNGKAGL